MPMAPVMKENGKMINNTALELSTGLIVASTLVTTSTPRRREKEDISGLMETNTMELGTIMPSMELVSIYGKMEECTMEIGETT